MMQMKRRYTILTLLVLPLLGAPALVAQEAQQQVRIGGNIYGGGNAAPVPATKVTIYGANAINNAFAGGNGAGQSTDPDAPNYNPGADVGYLGYHSLGSDVEYGTGKSYIAVYGGTVHNVYGGSNTLGYIRKGTELYAPGYYDNPEASANAFTDDGFLRTGDLGIIDEIGNITIKGRSKCMILSANGQNIYPEEIENVINTHELVTESIVLMDKGHLVALVSYDKEKLGKAIMAIGKNAEEAIQDIHNEVREYVNTRVNRFSRISSIEHHPDGFEKPPSQKIKRFLYAR